MSDKIFSLSATFQTPASDQIGTGWRAAWALQLTRPVDSFALASAALKEATRCGEANDLAWSWFAAGWTRRANGSRNCPAHFAHSSLYAISARFPASRSREGYRYFQTTEPIAKRY